MEIFDQIGRNENGLNTDLGEKENPPHLWVWRAGGSVRRPVDLEVIDWRVVHGVAVLQCQAGCECDACRVSVCGRASRLVGTTSMACSCRDLEYDLDVDVSGAANRTMVKSFSRSLSTQGFRSVREHHWAVFTCAGIIILRPEDVQTPGELRASQKNGIW